jgi:hypothetical protein
LFGSELDVEQWPIRDPYVESPMNDPDQTAGAQHSMSFLQQADRILDLQNIE